MNSVCKYYIAKTQALSITPPDGYAITAVEQHCQCIEPACAVQQQLLLLLLLLLYLLLL
jgi:hypothetical protein